MPLCAMHLNSVGLCPGLPSFRGMPPDVVGVYPVPLLVYSFPMYVVGPYSDIPFQ
jgi:hypothetical protein